MRTIGEWLKSYLVLLAVFQLVARPLMLHDLQSYSDRQIDKVHVALPPVAVLGQMRSIHFLG